MENNQVIQNLVLPKYLDAEYNDSQQKIIENSIKSNSLMKNINNEENYNFLQNIKTPILFSLDSIIKDLNFDHEMLCNIQIGLHSVNKESQKCKKKYFSSFIRVLLIT